MRSITQHNPKAIITHHDAEFDIAVYSVTRFWFISRLRIQIYTTNGANWMADHFGFLNCQIGFIDNNQLADSVCQRIMSDNPPLMRNGEIPRLAMGNPDAQLTRNAKTGMGQHGETDTGSANSFGELDSTKSGQAHGCSEQEYPQIDSKSVPEKTYETTKITKP